MKTRKHTPPAALGPSVHVTGSDQSCMFSQSRRTIKPHEKRLRLQVQPHLKNGFSPKMNPLPSTVVVGWQSERRQVVVFTSKTLAQKGGRKQKVPTSCGLGFRAPSLSWGLPYSNTIDPLDGRPIFNTIKNAFAARGRRDFNSERNWFDGENQHRFPPRDSGKSRFHAGYNMCSSTAVHLMGVTTSAPNTRVHYTSRYVHSPTLPQKHQLNSC